MIVSWPSRITNTGIRRQYTHATDIVPTVYECLGIEPPETLKGYTQFPLEGVSFAPSFDDPDARTGKVTQFYSMGGTAAIWHEGWKAASLTPSAPDMWADYAGQTWELFDTISDPSECHDLAANTRTSCKNSSICGGSRPADTTPCRWKTAVLWRSSVPSDRR